MAPSEIQARLKAVTTDDLRSIAKMSGVSYGSLLKLRYGLTDPRWSTLEKLREFFRLVR